MKNSFHIFQNFLPTFLLLASSREPANEVSNLFILYFFVNCQEVSKYWTLWSNSIVAGIVTNFFSLFDPNETDFLIQDMKVGYFYLFECIRSSIKSQSFFNMREICILLKFSRTNRMKTNICSLIITVISRKTLIGILFTFVDSKLVISVEKIEIFFKKRNQTGGKKRLKTI